MITLNCFYLGNGIHYTVEYNLTGVLYNQALSPKVTKVRQHFDKGHGDYEAKVVGGWF